MLLYLLSFANNIIRTKNSLVVKEINIIFLLYFFRVNSRAANEKV